MKDNLIDLAIAFIAYAGPLADPRIGWLGANASSPGLYRCERCGREHYSPDKIDHEEDCTALALLNEINKLKEMVREHE